MKALPDTALAREALEAVTAILPPPLLRHSQRAFLLARAYGDAKEVAFDDEGLYLAALFHDVGLADAQVDGSRAFPEVSADAFRRFMEGRSTEPSRSEAFAVAIEAHMALWPRWKWGPEVGLLHVGAWMDVVGRRKGSLPAGVIADVEQLLPRDSFERDFNRRLRSSVRSVRACVRLFAPRRSSPRLVAGVESG
jgi:hypothetical protein